MSNQVVAGRIRDTLNGLCPAFKCTYKGKVIWHECKCLLTGSACVCVWHITSECFDEKWKVLKYLDVQEHREEKERKILLNMMKERKEGSN